MLRLVSLAKLSEEAGIQCLGPDNVAIWKVRLIIIFTSSLISLVQIKDTGNYEKTFYPDIEIQQVILNIFYQLKLLLISDV